jgi:hypothetical protein
VWIICLSHVNPRVLAALFLQVSTHPLCGASLPPFPTFTSRATWVRNASPDAVLLLFLTSDLCSGQGFPDWPTPDFAKKALIDVCELVFSLSRLC